MAIEQVSTELLRGFSPLDGLKRDNLAALARKVQIRELSPGQLLFKEGDTEKRTIYVVSGILELVDQGKVIGKIEGGNPVAVAYVAQPPSAGSQRFYPQNHTRGRVCHQSCSARHLLCADVLRVGPADEQKGPRPREKPRRGDST